MLVQSSCPDEPAIQRAAQHDYEGFAKYELAQRRELSYPPYAHLARVILRGERYDDVHESAREMAKAARAAKAAAEHGIRILGPAPAPIARLRGQHRFHFQIAAAERRADLAVVARSTERFRRHIRAVEFTIDIDPIDMR